METAFNNLSIGDEERNLFDLIVEMANDRIEKNENRVLNIIQTLDVNKLLSYRDNAIIRLLVNLNFVRVMRLFVGVPKVLEIVTQHVGLQDSIISETCTRNTPDMLKVLLSIPGVDVNMRNPYMSTLLMSATNSCLLENVRILLERGADVNLLDIQDNNVLYYLFHHAIEYTPGHMQDQTLDYDKCCEIAKLLIANGADVNHQDMNYSNTALHIACSNAHFPLAKVLIDRGACWSCKDRYRRTPLDDLKSTVGDTEAKRKGKDKILNYINVVVSTGYVGKKMEKLKLNGETPPMNGKDFSARLHNMLS